MTLMQRASLISSLAVLFIIQCAECGWCCPTCGVIYMFQRYPFLLVWFLSFFIWLAVQSLISESRLTLTEILIITAIPVFPMLTFGPIIVVILAFVLCVSVLAFTARAIIRGNVKAMTVNLSYCVFLVVSAMIWVFLINRMWFDICMLRIREPYPFAAQSEIRKKGFEAVPYLLEALPSSSPLQKRRIIGILGSIEDVRAVKPLSEMLVSLKNCNDEDSDRTKTLIVRAFRRTGDRKVIPLLCDTWMATYDAVCDKNSSGAVGNQSSSVLNEIEYALNVMGREEAIKYLKFGNYSESELRNHAPAVLEGLLGEPSVLGELKQMTDMATDFQKQYVLIGIAYIGNREALSFLLDLRRISGDGQLKSDIDRCLSSYAEIADREGTELILASFSEADFQLKGDFNSMLVRLTKQKVKTPAKDNESQWQEVEKKWKNWWALNKASFQYKRMEYDDSRSDWERRDKKYGYEPQYQ
ncbi:MAG: HEAT repeat domain-containing protein [Candidatus Xenobiia bacterium LiM19]